jgi:cobalt-zinc-cadmium resistance protein CzcA
MQAIANHPAIQSLYQDAIIAEQTKKVEKAQGLPDFTIGYVNQSLIGFQTINGAGTIFQWWQPL